MLNYIPINCTNKDLEESQKLKTALEDTFKYTRKVNVHVIFNFKSPVDIIGGYKYVLFIDIPYENGNYFRSKTNKVYLNSLAIAVRNYEDNSISSIENGIISNREGSWNCLESIASETNALKKFVSENVYDIKHFDICIFHKITSSSCFIGGRIGNVVINSPLYWYDLISYAVELTSSNDGKKTNCLVYSSNPKKIGWEDFVYPFVEKSEAKTKQGILTKKKIDTISSEHTNKHIERACEIAGNKLCIITGKAGTGKSLVLMKIMYRKIRKDNENRNHRCRFLTYNNMLVMDIKQTIKNMGVFSVSNASISTLHSFFMDVYKRSPVRALHMNQTQINKLFAKCHYRVCNMVLLLNYYHDTVSPGQNIEAKKAFSYFVKNQRIAEEDYKECKQFCDYLYNKERYINFGSLDAYAKEYEEEKRKKFNEFYAQNEFLNGYNQILEDLYFMFHNKDEFIEKYGLDIVYSEMELRNSDEFQLKYGQLYDRFMQEARRKFVEENELISEKFISSFFEQESRIIEQLSEYKKQQPSNARKDFDNQVNRILRKVNWSDMIIVDEAQDCNPYEKALLLEMHGSDNIVIATGGKDQLIRTSLETTWETLFGKIINSEKVKLSYVYRQKANIVDFINGFAQAFNLETNLKASEDTKNQGAIIIDARNVLRTTIPEDVVKRLYLKGKDNGCSDYENIMFLIPSGQYIRYADGCNDRLDVQIDQNDTISFNQPNAERVLAVEFPEYLKVLDGTVNNKRDLLNRVGYDNVRCLLYESCRGLEAWSVMCMDLDDFFYNRKCCEEAETYALESVGFIQEQQMVDNYKEHFAALWVLMAITRAIDTLYIKLSSRSSVFSQKILEIGRNLPGVEILEDKDTRPRTMWSAPMELPF